MVNEENEHTVADSSRIMISMSNDFSEGYKECSERSQK
jgi:hypothetical protein